MTDALEQAVLSGKALAQTDADASSSPPRAASPTTSEELGSALSADEDDDEPRGESDATRSSHRPSGAATAATAAASAPPSRPGARTGAKGVMADRDAQLRARAEVHARHVTELNERLQRTALVSSALTPAGTLARGRDREREADDVEERRELDRIREGRLRELQRSNGAANGRHATNGSLSAAPWTSSSSAKADRMLGRSSSNHSSPLAHELELHDASQALPAQLGASDAHALVNGHAIGGGGGGGGAAAAATRMGVKHFRRATLFGHLSEVTAVGYVDAVERIPPGTAVVVHIYERSSPACAPLTAALTRLAREQPTLKFLQVRGSEIHFGSSATSSSSSSRGQSWTGAAAAAGGEEGAAEDDGAEGDEGDEAWWREEKARDVTPTLLVYVDGELRGNFVRPDLDESWGKTAGGVQRSVARLLAGLGVLRSVDGGGQRHDGVTTAAKTAASDEDEEDDADYDEA